MKPANVLLTTLFLIPFVAAWFSASFYITRITKTPKT